MSGFATIRPSDRSSVGVGRFAQREEAISNRGALVSNFLPFFLLWLPGVGSASRKRRKSLVQFVSDRASELRPKSKHL